MEAVSVDGVRVARIAVPKGRSEVATSSGVYLRRRIRHDGLPECVPMLPHDRASRLAHLGLVDSSALAVPGATLADFDPLERERLRQAVQQYGGDRVLLDLDDEALDGALGFTARQPDGRRVPTLCGLLLVGREAALRERVPTHEFAFQVLQREAVKFNEFRRFPMLKALDWLETNFRPYNPEDELQVGLFRVPVPMVDMAAFREAVANALIHRDYHRLGAVHVRLDDAGLTVSNPGGLVDGVTLANLLTTEPRPRNRTLADAMKRVGVVERSGRGVDKIFRGLLKFGRPAPDYSPYRCRQRGRPARHRCRRPGVPPPGGRRGAPARHRAAHRQPDRAGRAARAQAACRPTSWPCASSVTRRAPSAPWRR